MAEQSFNSTLVRLKVFVSMEVCDVCMFQFHTGSIKRLKEQFYAVLRTSVSIPHWFD